MHTISTYNTSSPSLVLSSALVHCIRSMSHTPNIISRDVLFCACHYSNVKARFLHKEETLACGLSLYHWCVRYHQDNSLYSLDIDKSECQITLILTRPQSLD